MAFWTATFLAARSAIVQPKRFAAALICTLAVAISAFCVGRLAGAGTPGILPYLFGGLVAFNNLLFFPPGALTAHPARIAATFLACLLPLWLSPHLYGTSPILADAALACAATVAALARPLGPPLAGLSLLVALNLLIPLILGGDLGLAPLGAVAAVCGTILAAGADLLVVRLLSAPTPGFERHLLRRELAGFLSDLSESWSTGRPLPDPSIAERIGRIRMLRQDMTSSPSAMPASALPPDAMLEGVERCAGALRSEKPGIPAEIGEKIGRALERLGKAARAEDLAAAHREIEDIRTLVAAGGAGRSGRVLGLALLLSDLVDAGLGLPASA